ncbi:MAG: leucine-rich repeat domain-containing protein [Candidatus Gracilibacteria bacterium]|nr:leucine-rich repeat domain-containing protein [Candidatus Gracilibacteria bacterium]
MACNYQQADIDILNSAGTNGNIGIYDNDWNTLSFPLTDVQWCYDVNYLKWYGGSTIIPEIFTLNSFNYLDLSDNSLTSIPVEIGNLTNLTVLYLNSNNLTTLPTQIGNLSNLTNLNLSSNQFTSIPVEIGNLSNLDQLDLGNNPSLGNLSYNFNNYNSTLSQAGIPTVGKTMTIGTNGTHIVITITP